MYEVITRWTGAAGLPGVTVMWAEGAGVPDTQPLRDFWAAISGLFPQQIALQVDRGGRVVDVNGVTTGAWSGGQPAIVYGTAASSDYAAPVGGVVNWLTDEFSGGRQVRGKTFLVPFATNIYDAQGNIDAPALGTLKDAADALIGSDFPLGIWSRSQALWSAVTAATVPDLAAILTSRRD